MKGSFRNKADFRKWAVVFEKIRTDVAFQHAGPRRFEIYPIYNNRNGTHTLLTLLLAVRIEHQTKIAYVPSCQHEQQSFGSTRQSRSPRTDTTGIGRRHLPGTTKQELCRHELLIQAGKKLGMAARRNGRLSGSGASRLRSKCWAALSCGIPLVGRQHLRHEWQYVSLFLF